MKSKEKLKIALAGMDEINTIWVSKMVLPDNEKQLRVEMMNEFERLLKQLKPMEKPKDKSQLLLLMGIYGVMYKEIYMEIFDKYFKRYIYEVSHKRNISDFSRVWIANHSQAFAVYSHDSSPQTIARTEVNSMCGIAQLDGYYQAGYTKKKWNTMGDSKVRTSHKRASGQIKFLEEPFILGDSLMMFPLDTSLGASAKEIVNCRCTMSPVK